MPTDTSHATHGEAADEHAETEPGTTLDPRDTERVLVAPEQPDQPLLLCAASATDGVHTTTQQSSGAGCRPSQRQTPLYRTERRLLETRIEALERTVQQREAQLDTVIEQYETVLENRQQYGDGERGFDRSRATGAFERGIPGTVRGVLQQVRSRGVLDRVRSAVRNVIRR